MEDTTSSKQDDEFDDNEDELVMSLKYGDVVTLSTEGEKGKNFLDGDGFASQEVSMTLQTTALNNFSQCVFRICPKHHYPATDDLVRARRNRETDVTTLERLTNALEKERSHNIAEMKRKCGTPVRYGDVIQLYHLHSGRYVSVFQKEVAKSEPTHLQIKLCEGHGVQLKGTQQQPASQTLMSPINF